MISMGITGLYSVQNFQNNKGTRLLESELPR
jgi:hypothetical protein